MGTAAAATPESEDLGGTLLVSLGRMHDGGTFEVDPNTGVATRQITRGVEGVYSPDGTRLAFSWAEPCTPDPESCYWLRDLRVAAADGTGEQVILPALDSGGEEAFVGHPDWTPNGRRIVFDSPNGLGWIKSDGHGYERLGGGSEPAVSPNGGQIAFLTVSGQSQVPDEPDPVDVHTMDLDTRTVIQRTNVGTAASAPDWSPDGSTIVYGGDDGLHTVDVATGQDKVIEAAVNPRTPVFSPDGTAIAYLASEPETGTCGLYVTDPAGAETRRISECTGTLTDWSAK
ncbi:TolB family protein [Streptomyces sp. MAR4 CNX-425]|uniref:TolB family protein n=1 Tax=Streptomyces sp. MAR4 CNX-425 TaxID=3406343 RepID=UPI003B514880